MTTKRGDIKLMIERMISAKTEIGMLPVIDDAVELFEKLDAELEAIKQLDLLLDKEQHRVELLESALREARGDIVSFGNNDWDCKANNSKPCTCWHQKSIEAIDKVLL